MSFPLSASIAGSLSTSIAVHAPASGSTLLLDTGVASASNGYSFRKLRTAYAGNCIKVRRSSDNTTLNIGFVSNALDTASMLTFCGAGNGFIDTWYDQVGSADLVQATLASQPQIVSAGATLTKNSKPCATFDGTASVLKTTGTTIGGATAFNAAAVGYIGSGAGNYVRMLSYLVTGDPADYQGTSVVLLSRTGTLTQIENARGGASKAQKAIAALDQLFTAVSGFDASNNGFITSDGAADATVAFVSVATGTPGTLAMGANGSLAGDFMAGGISETVLWTSNLSETDRTKLQSNQKAYWGTP